MGSRRKNATPTIDYSATGPRQPLCRVLEVPALGPFKLGFEVPERLRVQI